MATAVDRVFNFSAGPAVLPLPVLEEVQQNLLALPGVGSSILEISHRSGTFIEIMASATERLKRLLAIPAGYEVLYLQGGSRLQFSMVPMNLFTAPDQSADYILTGSWGKKARDEALREGKVNIAFDGKADNYNRLPRAEELKLDPGAAFVHLTSNETIEGVQFLEEPDVGNVPLVCDASSDFLCRPLDVEKYGMIYACAQKNAGPAGVTIVVMREDLLERSRDTLPGYLNYKNHAEEGSMYNTPNTFGVYVFDLVAKWLEEEIGGLTAMLNLNRTKSALIYAAVDDYGDFYQGHASPESRSLMNPTYRLPSSDLEKAFLSEAKSAGLHSLAGHRSVGGIRASIYNAMPMEGVIALEQFMRDFAEKNG